MDSAAHLVAQGIDADTFGSVGALLLALLDALLRDPQAFVMRCVQAVVGVTTAVHLICTANFLRPGTAPWHLALLLASGVAAAVALVHGAVVGNAATANAAALGVSAALIAFNLYVWAMGLHVCKHFDKGAVSMPTNKLPFTAARWSTILHTCGVRPLTAQAWAPIFTKQIQPDTFSGGLDELDDFLGQILHESGCLSSVRESLSYASAERLCAVWPKRFPTLECAQPYVRNPRALANLVYGGRMGNVGPDDGWLYIGRTPLQITGRDNYARVGALMGLDLVAQPDQLEEPQHALRACVLWWESTIPDALLGSTDRVTRLVNGGLIGLAERKHLTDEAACALASADADTAGAAA